MYPNQELPSEFGNQGRCAEYIQQLTLALAQGAGRITEDGVFEVVDPNLGKGTIAGETWSTADLLTGIQNECKELWQIQTLEDGTIIVVPIWHQG